MNKLIRIIILLTILFQTQIQEAKSSTTKQQTITTTERELNKGVDLSKQAGIFYLSYQGGVGEDAGTDARNNLDILKTTKGRFLGTNILDLSKVQNPSASSLRSLLVADSFLYVLSARTSHSRLLVSDQFGQQSAKIVWDQVQDNDPWFRHPYGLTCTPPYDPNGPIFGSTNRTLKRTNSASMKMNSDSMKMNSDSIKMNSDSIKMNSDSIKMNSASTTTPTGTSLYRRFFVSNQNTTSVSWYDIEVTTSHVYRHGLVSNSSQLNAVRGIVYDPVTMLLLVASKGANTILSFRVSEYVELDLENPPQLTPSVWSTAIIKPTFLLLDPVLRILFVGSDDPNVPALYALDVDTKDIRQIYTMPLNETLLLAGPSGLAVFNNTLFAASRNSRAIYMWDVETAEYLGVFIKNLPDVPEILYLLAENRIVLPPDQSIPYVIATVVVATLMLLIACVAGIAGLWRFWSTEQQRDHFAYQVVPFGDD